MELGNKLKQARLEAGLSQRQLCGETITRNMLSQIENGTASPSMTTLRYLAGRLGKPVSFFLEEDAVVSTNQRAMERAREACDRGDYAAAAEALDAFREPDPVYGWERQLLWTRTILALAEKALREDRSRYARELLERLPERLVLPELERPRSLLLLELGETPPELPSLDRELILRAKAAMAGKEPDRAARLLDAAEDRESPAWYLLRGEANLALGRYREAADCLTRAEEAYPRETALPLERCYRELGDYRRAYAYACRSRSFLG